MAPAIRNQNVANLPKSYFFTELEERREAAGEGLISLGMGDTTQPIPPTVAAGIQKQLENLSAAETFRGYGPPEGLPALRKSIAEVLCQGSVQADEVFVSDGAKCDISRLQWLFSKEAVVGVQDPVYPQYVDVSLLSGRTLKTLPCRPENGCFPDLDRLAEIDLLYFCAPNNPTGVMPTLQQLQDLIAAALQHEVVIILDTAYWGFIRDPEIPRSIYQLPGATETVIEVGSFSKLIGFTGVRTGWTIVPKQLHFTGGAPLHADWTKIVNITHNGTSNLSQQGALAALMPEGQREVRQLTDYYLVNAKRIRQLLEGMGISCIGGTDCPYVWAHFPGTTSWEMFQQILDGARVVTTPGEGFGSEGKEFVRFSGFCQQEQAEEACKRLHNCLSALV